MVNNNLLIPSRHNIYHKFQMLQCNTNINFGRPLSCNIILLIYLHGRVVVGKVEGAEAVAVVVVTAEIFAVFDVAFEEDALSMQVAPSVASVALSVPSVLFAIPCAAAAVAFPAVFVSSLAGFLFLSAASEAPAGAAA